MSGKGSTKKFSKSKMSKASKKAKKSGKSKKSKASRKAKVISKIKEIGPLSNKKLYELLNQARKLISALVESIHKSTTNIKTQLTILNEFNKIWSDKKMKLLNIPIKNRDIKWLEEIQFSGFITHDIGLLQLEMLREFEKSNVR